MKGFHVICGLPRSGSTLVCNILNQNPEIFASSTSPLPGTMALLSHHWSNSPEVKSDLYQRRGDDRLVRAARAMIEAWYEGEDKIVFDKSRGWGHNALLLKQLYPDAALIVMVRDLREVFASIEKRHRQSPILDHANNPVEKEIYTRADQMFGPQGMIGLPLRGILDMMQRNIDKTLIIQYETFVANPQMVVEKIYAVIGEKPYEHNFEDVKSTATDLDVLYLDKFPHNGAGPVEKRPQEWRDYVPSEIAGLIMQAYPQYNKVFGYV